LRPAGYESEGAVARRAASDGAKMEASAGMSDNTSGPDVRNDAEKPAAREPSPAARRALAEAEARRAKPKPETPPEFKGRGGLDPARFGDWEVKGIASDF
jgi:hypothetical protein